MCLWDCLKYIHLCFTVLFWEYEDGRILIKEAKGFGGWFLRMVTETNFSNLLVEELDMRIKEKSGDDKGWLMPCIDEYIITMTYFLNHLSHDLNIQQIVSNDEDALQVFEELIRISKLLLEFKDFSTEHLQNNFIKLLKSFHIMKQVVYSKFDNKHHIRIEFIKNCKNH